MAYINTTILNYGSKADFMPVLKNFFLNNEVAPFKLISEDSTATFPTFIVEYNNLRLELRNGTAAEIEIAISKKNKNREYVSRSSISLTVCSTSSNVSVCCLPVLLAVNGDTLVFQIAGYSSSRASHGTTVIDTVLENGTSTIGVGKYSNGTTTIEFQEADTHQPFFPRPFHTGSYDETTLILSNKLAFNDSNGVYCSSTTDIISAGGANQFEYYTTDTNNYYGLLTDVCIPIGEKLEYEIGA